MVPFRKYPSLVEVVGYIFHFSGIICGPIFFFGDYIDFITGDNLTPPSSENSVVGFVSPHIVHVDWLCAGVILYQSRSVVICFSPVLALCVTDLHE